MIGRIRKMMLGGAEVGTDDGDDDVQASAVALLIETALMDGEFDASERETISRLLAERFGLDAGEVDSLIAAGTEAVERSAELFGFTRVLKRDFDHRDRVRMLEMLWEVAYADGRLHDYEANLVRRIAGLLHVPDRESGAARKRVLERLDNQARSP